MRECPGCGFMDPSIWKHKKHRLYTDYCHITELQAVDPELAALILEKKDLKILRYIYHLTKTGYVDRIHESDSKDGVSYMEADQEKPRSNFKKFKFQPVSQKKLILGCKKGR